MGFAATWCAVREQHAEEVLEDLGLKATETKEESPRSLVAAAKLDTGWRVIWYNAYECPFLGSENLARISRSADVVVCRIEEHVMASSAEGWFAGQRKWWIAHDGQDGPKGLASGGALPESFASIRRELEEAQRAEGGEKADVDYLFEIPLRVAEEIVGFKHDEKCEHLTEGHFLELSDGRPKKGLLGRLFR